MMEAMGEFLKGPQWELLIFAGLAVLTLISALFVVAARRVTHACLSLLPCFIGIAGLYAVLGSSIMLAFQLLIYAGGIMVLMLFAIFLLERRTGPIVSQHHMVVPGLLVAGLMGLILLGAIRQTHLDFDYRRNVAPPMEIAVEGSDGQADRWYAYYEGDDPTPTVGKSTNVRRTGFYFLTYYMLPFELTSLVLVVAMIGAIIMARRDKGWVAAGKIMPRNQTGDEAEDADDKEGSA